MPRAARITRLQPPAIRKPWVIGARNAATLLIRRAWKAQIASADIAGIATS